MQGGCPEDHLTPATMQSGFKDTAADVGIPDAIEHDSAASLFASLSKQQQQQQGHSGVSAQAVRKVRASDLPLKVPLDMAYLCEKSAYDRSW